MKSKVALFGCLFLLTCGVSAYMINRRDPTEIDPPTTKEKCEQWKAEYDKGDKGNKVIRKTIGRSGGETRRACKSLGVMIDAG